MIDEIKRCRPYTNIDRPVDGSAIQLLDYALECWHRGRIMGQGTIEWHGHTREAKRAEAMAEKILAG